MSAMPGLHAEVPRQHVSLHMVKQLDRKKGQREQLDSGLISSLEVKEFVWHVGKIFSRGSSTVLRLPY